MLKKLVLLFVAVFMTAGLFSAEPKMAMLPARGRGPAAKLSENITEEMKLVYRTIRGAVAVDPEKVMSSDTFRAFIKCGTNRRCVEKVSAEVRDAELVLLPLVTVRRDKSITVNLYIYSQGSQVARYVVKVDAGFDEEDIAADVAAALMTVSSDIASAPGSSSSDDYDDEPEVEDRRDRDRDRESSPLPKMSNIEARTTLRNGFKAYKKGNVEEASRMFRDAGDGKLAQDAEDVAALIDRAKSMINDGDLERAMDSLKKAERIDIDVRERGYKELQFIRETTRRDRYNEPKEQDFRKVDALFRDIRKDISEVARWRKDEIDKAERSIGDQLREREKINRDFEDNEEKQRAKEKAEERDHKRKIEDMKRDMAGLDGKYRQKITDVEKEIGLMNRRLDDQRPAEEKFRREIENELKELDKKRKSFELKLRKELGQAKRKSRIAAKKAVNDAKTAFKKLEDTIKGLEKKLAAIQKDIEKANIDFDRNEQKEAQIFERATAKAEAQDRKDIEEVEKANAKEVAAFNRELEDYDKKISDAAKKIDVVEREIANYIEKQDKRLQKSQELANRKREELERRFDGQRRAAENKAQEEYRKGQQERARKIESLEKQILAIEEKNPDYDKDGRWKSLRNQLRTKMDELVKYEENSIKFIEDKMSPVVKVHEGNIKKLEEAFTKLENKVKKEIADFTKKKNQEKAAAERNLKNLEKNRAKFEAGIRKKIENANAVRDRKIKEIEGRVSKRDAERVAKAKQRRAAFEKEIESKRKEFAKTEKQMSDLSAQGEKLREDTRKKLDQMKMDNEKMLSDLEIAHEKQREAQEIAFEKERIAIYQKYEKKAEEEKKELISKIDQKEKEMRGILAERGKEEVNLRKAIEDAEKQTDVMYNRWENEAKQRRVALDGNLAAAEKRENAAKAKLKNQIKSIEDQYNSKVEAIINAAAKRLGGSGDKFTTERDRAFEFSAQTKEIYNLMANALSSMGNEKLSKGDISGARKDFYEAMYYERDNKLASDGLNAIKKQVAETYEKASQIMNKDPREAKKMLLGLRRHLEPDDSYYLKTMALLEELR